MTLLHFINVRRSSSAAVLLFWGLDILFLTINLTNIVASKTQKNFKGPTILCWVQLAR